jgi:hypothetical protein
MATTTAAGAAPSPAFAYPSAHSSNPAYLGPRSSSPDGLAPSSDVDPLALRRLVLPALYVEPTEEDGEDEVMDDDDRHDLDDEDGLEEDEEYDGEGDVTVKQEEGEDFAFVRLSLSTSALDARRRRQARSSRRATAELNLMSFPSRRRATQKSLTRNQNRNPRRRPRMRWTTGRRGRRSSSAKR